uniref:HIT-type domain-containing protein n=1 Tax=Heterorhabditis bacteriophora TaxID=37862 RepID=A0A1I7X406_HETBA
MFSIVVMRSSASSSSLTRHSARIEGNESTRVLDSAARNRRLKRQLDALEQDNAHDDPHANLVWHKAIPKFDENDVIGGGGQKGSGRKRLTEGASDESARKKRRFRAEHSKQRFRKNFVMLLEEENQANKDDPRMFMAYSKATAPPSKVPPRHFCVACGFPSKYTCIRCGARYCCIRCRDIHNDTRCMKWIV